MSDIWYGNTKVDSSYWNMVPPISGKERQERIEKYVPFYRNMPIGTPIKILKPRVRSHSSGFFAGAKGNYIRVRIIGWNGYKQLDEIWKYHVLDISCDAIKLMEAL